jgi:acyl-CoA reductase-like NAD-dependent aldehyde dehydrogenase
LIEASGYGPVIVCEDADLERAAQGAVFGGFFCAGQVCCATERVLVHERVHDAFLDEVLATAADWHLGDPFDDSTLVGPMNNEPPRARWTDTWRTPSTRARTSSSEEPAPATGRRACITSQPSSPTSASTR